MREIPAFPGLLRPGSTVIFAPHIRNMYGGKDGGVVFMAGNVAALVTYLEDCRPAPIPLEELSLDLSDSTGRFHARMWLAEQGQPTSEDRQEVLAWNVESVRRGGGLLQGVMLTWEPNGLASMWIRKCERGADVYTYQHGWRRGPGGYLVPGISCGPDAIKAEADAALLVLGWALTNPDGSLTLPPLPEVTRG